MTAKMGANQINVLIITRNAWDDTNSIGNTMSNFFGDTDGINTANIYFRSAMPNNHICSNYFRVTEKDIIRNYFAPEKIGKAFQYDCPVEEKNGYSSEKKLISFVHRFGLKGVYALSDYLWDSKKWLNNKLDKFIEDFDPDVVFTFAKSLPQYYHIIKYLHEKHHKKIVLWIADDEYTALSLSPKKKDKKRIARLKEIISDATVLWGCSEEMCGYYNTLFGCNAKPLYKSCRFTYPVKNTNNQPVRLIYAGNLLFGRLEILIKIAEQLKEINRDKTSAVLDVYSSTPLSAEQTKELSIPGVSSFNGVKPYAEIQRLMSESDLILHIESFEEKEILKTKYSFSTKIIDCLQSGSVMLAVGPKEIASIRYIKTIPGAFVIDDESAIKQGIYEAVAQSGSYPERAAEIRSFAEKHHSPDNRWLSL